VNVSIPAVRIPAAIALSVCLSACHRQQTGRNDYGILPCSPNAAADLLSTDALECWFTAAHGRWRTLSHQEAYGALVVQVEAFDPADASEIARRFVESKHEALSEVSVYVQRESTTDPTLIRRIRWTPDAGYETLEFTAPAAR
jgi:hypothetical protein